MRSAGVPRRGALLPRLGGQDNAVPVAQHACAHQDVLDVRDLSRAVARLVVGPTLHLLDALDPMTDAMQTALGHLATKGVDRQLTTDGDATILDPLEALAELAELHALDPPIDVG